MFDKKHLSTFKFGPEHFKKAAQECQISVPILTVSLLRTIAVQPAFRVVFESKWQTHLASDSGLQTVFKRSAELVKALCTGLN